MKFAIVTKIFKALQFDLTFRQQPFGLMRLSHMFGGHDMENTKLKSDKMVSETSFEFVEVNNARIVPSAIDEEEDWDIEGNMQVILQEANPFSSDENMPELECSNFEQLSVQSNEEVSVRAEALRCTTLLTVEPHRLSEGILGLSFRIENVMDFLRGNQDVDSETFKCRNIPFHIFLKSSPYTDVFSVYLKRAEDKDDGTFNDMEILVTYCEMTVTNQSGMKVVKEFHNRVFTKNSDWGFTEFLGPDQMQNVALDDHLTIHMTMRADPPYCDGHIAKATTGFVGIKNQGALCYMNSLLQALFHITKFRTACYRIPTEMDADSSMALSLQKVFYNLQFSDVSVCTKALTHSFGWSSPEVLQQQDIQEMMRVLIEKIEIRMKNTSLEEVLAGLFQGKFISYVKCRDVEISSHREEIFYDIQFSLENSNSVMDSFRKYITPEIMDDDNKYDAGQHGLQAAEKGTFFTSLPHVMFLHLLRFQFDATTGQVVKNNNYYEFSEHIDLSEFVREDDTTCWKYTLFAVLSHSGGGSHGHYVAYANPSLKGTWLKFDDEMISVVHKLDAIDANFGNHNMVDEWTRSMQFNAYMLVYVRDSCAVEIFEPVDPMYISDELKASVFMDLQRELNCDKYVRESPVYVFTNSDIETEIRGSLTRAADPKIWPKFMVTRDLRTTDFKEMLLNAYKLTNLNQMRIWPISYSVTNHTNLYHIGDDVPFLATLTDRRRSPSNLAVWLETALPGSELPPFDPNKQVLVFYFFYVAKRCEPTYVLHGYHELDAKVGELIPKLNELMEWSSDRELNVYQDLRQMKISKLDPTKSFSDYVEREWNTFVMNVIFEPKDHDESTKLHSIELHYADVVMRAHYGVCNEDEPKHVEHFHVSTQTIFPEFLNMLAMRLNYDINKIQLFKHSSSKDIDSEPIPSTSTEMLYDLVSGAARKRIHFSYKLHGVNVADIENKQKFTFNYLSSDLHKTKALSLYLSNDESMESILSKAKMIIPRRPTSSGKFHMLQLVGNRLQFVNDVKEVYESIVPDAPRNETHFQIEEIPLGDDVLNENERYVSISQTTYSQSVNPKNSPLFFINKINFNETWQFVKDRLRCRLQVSKTIWDENFKVSVLTEGDELLDVDDAKCLGEYEELQSTFAIGLIYNFRAKRSCNKIDISC